MEQILEGHYPYPAVIMDRNCLLVSANDTLTLLTDGVAPELLEPPVNLARLMLHPRGVAPRIANFDQWAFHVWDALCRETTRNPYNELDALVEELASYLPERLRQPPAGHLGFAVPLQLRTDDTELRLLSTLTHFGTAVDVTVAELRLEAFLPADRKTSEYLRMR